MRAYLVSRLALLLLPPQLQTFNCHGCTGLGLLLAGPSPAPGLEMICIIREGYLDQANGVYEFCEFKWQN
jgi:hypothetical protein